MSSGSLYQEIQIEQLSSLWKALVDSSVLCEWPVLVYRKHLEEYKSRGPSWLGGCWRGKEGRDAMAATVRRETSWEGWTGGQRGSKV